MPLRVEAIVPFNLKGVRLRKGGTTYSGRAIHKRDVRETKLPLNFTVRQNKLSTMIECKQYVDVRNCASREFRTYNRFKFSS